MSLKEAHFIIYVKKYEQVLVKSTKTRHNGED